MLPARECSVGRGLQLRRVAACGESGKLTEPDAMCIPQLTKRWMTFRSPPVSERRDHLKRY